MNEFIAAPDPLDTPLTRAVFGIDQTGAAVARRTGPVPAGSSGRGSRDRSERDD
jgi:hypothetical protein